MPALVPFTFTDGFKAISERLSGLSVTARISTAEQSFLEPVLFTHRGLSGPAVLQLSSYWREGLPVDFNLMPEHNAPDAYKNCQENLCKAVFTRQQLRMSGY